MIKRIIKYLKHDIWQKGDIIYGKVNWVLRPFKIILYTLRGVGEHKIMLRAAALTYFSIMSLVPMSALVLGILKGFGFKDNLTQYLYANFPEYSDFFDILFELVNQMQLKTSGGIIAIIAIVIFFWSVMRMFGNIEEAFNNIWEVKKSRSVTRKFMDYTAVIFIAPILLVSSISLSLYLQESMSFMGPQWFVRILFGIISFVLIWGLFTFIYWLMPNDKVRLKGAFIAGVIAGTAFYIFSVTYFYIQNSVSSYNLIYGTFAAIPFFLVWLQFSWQILLIGAELSFAYQNINRYEQERKAVDMDIVHKRKVLLATMLSVVKHFIDKQGAVSAENIASELNLPVRIIRDMVFELEQSGLLIEVKSQDEDRSDLYIPAKDVHTITVADVMDQIDKKGSGPDFDSMAELKKVSKLIDDMRNRAFDSDLNVLLTELI